MLCIQKKIYKHDDNKYHKKTKIKYKTEKSKFIFYAIMVVYLDCLPSIFFTFFLRVC